MNSWTRCRRCGGVNDYDATNCYLCGCETLANACTHCGTPFANPLDTRCPACNEPYDTRRLNERNAEFEPNSGET
ncbi:MAG: hypothetical protein H6616_11780 [Ignavibacteria bacterium]|nr:hypothetical protein [Ignavibacteria bacterium]